MFKQNGLSWVDYACICDLYWSVQKAPSQYHCCKWFRDLCLCFWISSLQSNSILPNILPYFTQSKNEIRTACTEAFRPHLSKNASSRKVKTEDMRTTAVCILWWSSVRVVSSSIVWLRTLRNCWGPRANCTTDFIFVDISLDMFWHGVKIAGQSRKTFIWFHLALSQNYLKLNIGPKGSISLYIYIDISVGMIVKHDPTQTNLLRRNTSQSPSSKRSWSRPMVAECSGFKFHFLRC